MSNDENHTELEQSLRETPASASVAWERIRRDLAGAAERSGLIDVAFERHDSPLGTLIVGATRDGLVRVGLPAEDEDAVLHHLADRVSARVLHASRDSLVQARRELDEYFDRSRREFGVPLDWRLSGGFRREVLRATAEIPYGETASYRDVAARAGNAGAVRAAGTALATNPLPIVVPCHRVVRSGGALGGYGGGPEAKALLLGLEGALRVPPGRPTG
jgi:methylated-DNA-[protein]-cysteine S-methyltransferase